MARKRRTVQEHELAVSDQAAAYIADALMQLALDFENTHYAQIRRHHQASAIAQQATQSQVSGTGSCSM